MEKKSSKWQCKLCGERQSLKQVFAKGSGSECRKAVQELNLKRMEASRQEEQKLEAAIMEEENRCRFAENVEEHNHHVFEGNFESVQERAELFESRRRSPLAAMQASASGSRWGKFLPSSTSAWEEEEDDLEEEIQGFGLSGKWHSWDEDENGPEEQEDEHHGVPSKKSKSHVGKRKAIDAHAGNSFSSAGNVPSKWGKFSS